MNPKKDNTAVTSVVLLVVAALMALIANFINFIPVLITDLMGIVFTVIELNSEKEILAKSVLAWRGEIGIYSFNYTHRFN